MPWWVGTIIGAACLVTLNGIKQGIDLNFINFWLLFPLLAGVQLGFWYGFRYAPNFINCWFIGSAMSGVLGLAAGLLFFDKHITANSLTGVILVFCGAYFLARG